MEVVLPDGTLWRSGMGGLPNPNADPNAPPHEQAANETWGLFNYGFGPYNDGIFTQSSLGIVVKMGIWLMVNPGGYQSVSGIPSDKCKMLTWSVSYHFTKGQGLTPSSGNYQTSSGRYGLTECTNHETHLTGRSSHGEYGSCVLIKRPDGMAG